MPAPRLATWTLLLALGAASAAAAGEVTLDSGTRQVALIELLPSASIPPIPLPRRPP
ncbi:hypothetical protein [Endothiovibrio diazotrophicus]